VKIRSVVFQSIVLGLTAALVLTGCNMSSQSSGSSQGGQPTAVAFVHMPAMYQTSVAQFTQSGAGHWFLPTVMFPTATDAPTVYDVTPVMYYQGTPYVNGFGPSDNPTTLTFSVPTCLSKVTIPAGSFTESITVDRPLNFFSDWLAMTGTLSADYGIYNTQTLATGSQTQTVFTAAGEQKTFTQDIPFSLPCGQDFVAFAMNVMPPTEGDLPGTWNWVSVQVGSKITLLPTSIHLPAFVSNVNAYCRSGPDPIFSQVSLAFKGQPYPIVGRNLDSTYYDIQVSPQAECWVLASSGQAQGSLAGIPVMITPPTPTVTLPPAPVTCSNYPNQTTCTSHPACKWNPYNVTSGGECTNK